MTAIIIILLSSSAFVAMLMLISMLEIRQPRKWREAAGAVARDRAGGERP
jgi:hypothetical protein